MKNNCMTALSLFQQKSVLTATVTPRCTVPLPSPAFGGFQGGCSDGKRYYYQTVMHYELSDRTKDYARIAKIDLSTGQVVQWSRDLSLDHANDMTYHPGTNRLIVCNNKPHPNRLTLLNADTLEPTKTAELPFAIYSIDYNPTRDLYAVGLSGTREFRLLGADFKPLDDRVFRCTHLTDRHTKQGVCVDDNLIYFIMWDGKHKDMEDFQSVIAVYDWDGAFRGLIEFDVGKQEPENLSIVNGKILAVCGNEMPIIYQFDPTLP
ncbi:MAG: hypothetical protein IJX39_06485 [Clostridia bacterium]|nr:hypothetical protein [Clostridia bacterium]